VRAGLIKSLLLASVISLIGGGCGGIAATQTIYPLMFLLPGFGQARPAAPSNAPPALVASANRDSSQVN
jgi:hypothetical protein